MTTPLSSGLPLSPAIGLGGKQADHAALKAAARQFEAVFLRQMIGAMRQASLGDDILGSSAGDQFRDMADARTADAMAEKGAIGIADMLIAQFQPKAPASTLPKDSPGPAVETGK